MKTKGMVKGLLLGAILIWLMFPWVGHTVPATINYQGYLMDSVGTPINATVPIVFSFYDVASGGIALWTETQNVVVASGVYSVNLGSVNPITVPFDAQYYLGVKVGTDPEMAPRKALTSVGYAFRAESSNYVYGSGTFVNPLVSTVATGTAPLQVASTTNVVNFNGDMLDGQHATAFAAASHNHDDRYYDKGYVDALEARIAALEAKLNGLTRSGNDFIITNANLYIQSGSGYTYGTINGKGNLIIGYNESRGGLSDVRTGSHNLIVGNQQNYSSYGGLVVGQINTISAPYSSVSGGYLNTASGEGSSVSGGSTNTASSWYSSVSGGHQRSAGDTYGWVAGELWQDQ